MTELSTLELVETAPPKPDKPLLHRWKRPALTESYCGLKKKTPAVTGKAAPAGDKCVVCLDLSGGL